MNPNSFPSDSPPTGDVVLSVRGVSKKFCRNLKRSMLYGMQDLGRNLIGGGTSSTNPESLPPLRKDEFWALQDINFELKRGECLGLIGQNGSGKSTLLRLLTGIFPPDAGTISLQGRVGALIALGAGFHPHLTGRENIYLNGAILGLTRAEIDAQLQEIIDFAEIGKFIDAPVSTYSSGMTVRLGFSVATAMKPDLLLIDEVLAVGDAGFRAKCFHRIGHILKNAAVVFVSHDMVQVSRICNSTMLLHKGVLVQHGPSDAVVDKYLTMALESVGVESRTVLDPRIRAFHPAIDKPRLEYGDVLTITLSFEADEEIDAGLCLFALGAFEGFHAQTDFTKLLPRISQGRSSVTFRLGPICLRKDDYQLSVTILDQSKKNTLVHAICCLKVPVGGQRGYGVAYQTPVALVQP